MADYTQPKHYMRYFAVKKLYYLFLISNLRESAYLKNKSRPVIARAIIQLINLGRPSIRTGSFANFNTLRLILDGESVTFSDKCVLTLIKSLVFYE